MCQCGPVWPEQVRWAHTRQSCSTPAETRNLCRKDLGETPREQVILVDLFPLAVIS